VREDDRDHGQQIDPQKLEVVQAEIGRQQDVEDGRRDNQIGPRNQQLQGGDARTRQRNLGIPEANRLLPKRRQSEVADGQAQQPPPQWLHRCKRQRKSRRDRKRIDQEQHARQREDAEPEREAQHQHQPHDVDGGQPPGGIQAVTDRRPPQQGAEVVAGREARERRQRDLAQRQRMPDRTDRQEIIADQDQVVQGRQADGQPDAARRNHAQTVADVAHPVVLQLVVQQPGSTRENQHHHDGADGVREFLQPSRAA